jgi:two-component system response regulator
MNPPLARDGIVLLVEDNPDDVDLTIHAFRSNGLSNEIVVARDGAEALDYLFGSGSFAAAGPQPLPIVMILDLNLPRISGLEVLRQVRAHERTRLLPTVVLTTSVEQRDVVEGYRLGANAYVQKPVALEEFVVAAGRLGLFWLLVNVRPPAAGG